jgi:hypothetical protein
MSRKRQLFLEWLMPGRVRSSAIPPLEAGMRPNSRLDSATRLAELPPYEVDDVTSWNGSMVVASGDQVLRLDVTGTTSLGAFPGDARALAVAGDRLVVAVEGHGLMALRANGQLESVCADGRVATGVTAVVPEDGGGFLVCVGSTTGVTWEQALVRREATGLLLAVGADGGVQELARDLAWPAGVAVHGDEAVVAVSQRYVLQRRRRTDGKLLGDLLHNLPGYPGRLTPANEPGEWWVAMPYMRNRATELMLEEDDLRDEMVARTEPESWLVPVLSTVNEYRSPLQVGQIRVLGEIKPWAPPRSYGLVFRVSHRGQVLASAHSRADGSQHGVTGVTLSPIGSVVVAVRGAGTVLEVEEES